jgi:ABC-type lipoprotein release transport system permease subunit
MMGDFPVWGTIYGVWNIDSLIFVFTFGIIIATIASIIPARSAARLQITKALKFN